MTKQHGFAVGQAVTMCVGSDRYEGTVDSTTATQVLASFGNLGAHKFTLRGNGDMREAGGRSKLIAGHSGYLDPSF